MLSFVQSWFAPAASPIGVDFGTDCLRLAQVEPHNGEFRLVAAASADVPAAARQDPASRITFFAETVRELLSQGNFRGRRAVMALPASSMFIQHLRVAKMDDEELRKALPWEARGKIPIDPNAALLRHLVAGEVYQDQEQKTEIILMAAAREWVNGLLAAAARSKLDVVGMNVEPKALIDCFAQIYRRKTDAEVTNCFIDIGCSATRAVVACGSQILFARVIPVGGDHFTRAAAAALKISFEDAKVLRIKLAHLQRNNPDEVAPPPQANTNRRVEAPPVPAAAAAETDENNSFALLGAGLAAASARTVAAPAAYAARPQAAAAAPRPAAAEAVVAEGGESSQADQLRLVQQACREPLQRLVQELGLCRQYHESVFPNLPIDRLVFVGGEARHRWLCQHVAQQLSLAAQVGDPLVRMGRVSEVGIESGIDRRQPQPAWAVAIGLSMGPVANGEAGAK